MSVAVTPHDFPEIRWQGHWIWVPEEPITPSGALSAVINPQAPETHGLFRKTVHLDQVPDRAPARITADSRYALFVNGQEVFRGPIRSQPRRLHYDLFDLAPHLQPGENILAAYVKYYGTPKSYWMPAAPNLTLGKTGILVFEADLGVVGWLVSDASWKARKADAWSDDWRNDSDDPVGGGVPIEVFDARRFPHDWRDAGFDDRGWGAAQVVPAMHIGGFAHTQPPTDPYGPLYPRPIAKLGGQDQTPATVQVETLDGQVDKTIASPSKRVRAAAGLHAGHTPPAARLPVTVDMPPGGMVRLNLDMGHIVSGLVTFEIQAPTGTVLDLAYLEEPLNDPTSNIDVRAGTRYIARGANDRFQVFDSNGFRYAYILVHGVHGSVTLQRFAVQEQLYPWEEGASFSCDDEELNRIFTAGIRSEFLVDGYDTIGECWGWGTHVHGWSCTPTRDMIFYTLGVMPAEPGYTKARIAPRLGRLAWVKGNVPTPHGMISVEASIDRVTVDSPVPVVVDLVGQPARDLPRGRHELAIP